MRKSNGIVLIIHFALLILLLYEIFSYGKFQKGETRMFIRFLFLTIHCAGGLYLAHTVSHANELGALFNEMMTNFELLGIGTVETKRICILLYSNGEL